MSRPLLICSIIAYLALTAPIANEHYGWLRPPLLLFTDLTSYALLNYYWLSTRGVTLWSVLPKLLKTLTILWFFSLVILFFGYAGKAMLHDINHMVGFGLLLVILIDSVFHYSDDLVERRRLMRRLMMIGISFYMLLLTMIELLFNQLKDDPYFSFGNALLAFILVCIYARPSLSIEANTEPEAQRESREKTSEQRSENIKMAELTRLKQLMDSGFYTEHNLSIGKLARELKLPEHRVRQLINNHLGYDNFSHFINSYRIPAVCKKLRDPARTKEPILTLALETGFNSIASFNRSFKKEKGVTASEFRNRI
ncbi:helix-turn-helix domain-containing protein [Planctobacterium marinum]|uniref:HTH araC/xylS-type domain-containing protein n=1 Tax=Planctobacterium marinum TaxID=1631968 RepID=A0AA48HKY8_9ALTE|nr:hypothetical protein MACH26_38670 [Planctobacterium marinum]